MNIKEIVPGLTQIFLNIPRGGFESFINAWLIDDKSKGRAILMETGPASSVPRLVADLNSLGIDSIDYLVYSHIHMDHAGGVGHFIHNFPSAKVLAPEKGRRHLVDPAQLIEGSKANIGNLFDVYGAPEPISEEALLPVDFKLDGLDIIDTPGHAPHHSSYVYNLDGMRILFAGEAAGCCYELPDGSLFMRPATPHKFYYETAMESLDKLLALPAVDMVCYPHSGASVESVKLLTAAKKQMKLWLDIISDLPEDAGTDDAVKALLIEDPMLKHVEKLPENDRKREAIFLRQSADGYLGYIRRKRAS